MKTLVVGNSLDVLPVLKHIAQNTKDEMVLFTTEGVLPYDRSLLPAMLAGDEGEAHLFKTSEIFLASCRPEVITGQKLSKISVKRRYLTTEEKKQISYDRLVLVDTGHLLLPEIRGHQRTGVFDGWRFSSIKALKKHLPFADSIMVPATRIQGLNIACAMAKLKKEVTILSPKSGLLPDIFDEETGLLLKQIVESKGIRVIGDAEMDEILGDAEVKAVKFKSGKVIACDTIVFDAARADIRMLSEPTLTGSDEISIEECFKPPIMPFEPARFGLDII